MEINNSNYEIWLLDWLDGSFNDLQVEQLQLFLNENPELREEFNEISSQYLKPSGKSFPQKDQLIKSTADLSVSQFEHLCVAYLENDLSSGQQTELKEIIGNDPEKLRSFELIQKMRLAPDSVTYIHKKKLIKLTPVQKVIRLSVIGLTIAATVALIILTNIIIPRNQHNKLIGKAQNILADSTLIRQPNLAISKKPVSERTQIITKQKRETKIDKELKNEPVLTKSGPTPSIPVDSLVRNTDFTEILITKVPVYTEILLKEKTDSRTLIVSYSNLTIPEYDDERSKLSKFIARTFREKLLKETISKDSPLKVYEIAEAGVAGINKLLGWEMALEEKKDENGEMTSVYFSSRILKFNAPVKKTESLQ